MNSRFLFLIGLLYLFTMNAIGQNVIFSSQEMEMGVKHHLGMDMNGSVTYSQLDTITEMDLSSLGLTDISDLGYMPKIRKLDLHDNFISDISPLLTLDSLASVNLSHNELSSIFRLSYSKSKKMTVDVSFNYINDFSVFATLTQCQFYIIGAKLQMKKNEPYFRMQYLYSDATTEKVLLYCKLDATTTDNAQMVVHGTSQNVKTDNLPYVYQVKNDVRGTEKVVVTDGVFSDSTYVVTLQRIHVNTGEVVTIDTKLPEDFKIQFVTAAKGTCEVVDKKIVYNPGTSFDYDEIIYTFYCGGLFRGIAKVILTSEDVPSGIDNTTNELSKMQLELNGNILNVKCPENMVDDESVIELCDVAGRRIASVSVNSTNGIDESIEIAYVPDNIIIVRITSGNKRYADKYLVK